MATARERLAENERRLAQQRSNQGPLLAQSASESQLADLMFEQAQSGGGDESGLITGPFVRRAREQRELVAAQAAIEAEAIEQSGIAQSTARASGVDFQQLSPDVAAGIQQLLGREDTRPEGVRRLDQAQAQQGLMLTPAQNAQARRASVDLRIADQSLITAEMQNNMLRLEQDVAFGRAPDRQLLTDQANLLRGERAKDLAPYNDSLRSYDELLAAIELDSGPASMAVLFKFIKALDDSVVRSSEGQLLTSSSGPVRALVDQFNQIQAGGLFGEDTKADILEVATAIAESQFSTAMRINAEHDRVAARFGERFGMPSVVELSQSAAFDRGRSFEERSDPTPAPTRTPVPTNQGTLEDVGGVIREDGVIDFSGAP